MIYYKYIIKEKWEIKNVQLQNGYIGSYLQ